MIPNHAKYSFIVVDCWLRCESHNDSGRWLTIDSSLYLREGEHILLVCDELEWSWQIALIDYVKESISSLAKLNFSKMDGRNWKWDIEACSMALARES